MSVWHYLTTDEQEEVLTNIVNKQLAKAGVPPVKGVVAGFESQLGRADFYNWKIFVDRSLFASWESSRLARVVMHEARHMEQVFRAAQVAAPESQIWGCIPKEVAQAAQANPLAANASGPAVLGEATERSIFGKGSSYRESVHAKPEGGRYEALPEEQDANAVGNATKGCE